MFGSPRHRLGVRRYVAGAKDRHGNPVDSWSAAQEWRVWALAPGASAELVEAGRDGSRIAWTVYAPASADAPGERDRVLVGSDEFEVDGRPLDWTKGPWPSTVGGVVVALTRVEG